MSKDSRESAVEQFARDVASEGCRINYAASSFPPGSTCITQQDSARAAQEGAQPMDGPRWGSEDAAAIWRDRVAAGELLCLGCRAVRARDGVYYPPGRESRR
jgi:hypothetical protein